MAGIYIHIPFCKQACHYCDFHFSTNSRSIEILCKSIKLELLQRKEYLPNDPIDTIYFGGGTPSMLSLNETEDILNVIYKNYRISALREITLEANPDDLNDQKIKDLHSLGFSRLSIGIQSFNNQALRFMNRSHNADQALRAIRRSMKSGIKSISADLIFQVPGFGIQTLEGDLNMMQQEGIEHISAYGLTIEEKTVFGKWVKSKKLTPAGESFAAGEFGFLMDWMSSHGFEQYEISNFAKDRKYGIHNSNYWKGIPYLGIGPSAHSFNGQSRQVNISNNNQYIKSVEGGSVLSEVEALSRENQINEMVLTGLRIIWGLDLKILLNKYDFDLLSSNRNEIESMLTLGLITHAEDKLYLTKKGRYLADEIASRLFV